MRESARWPACKKPHSPPAAYARHTKRAVKTVRSEGGFKGQHERHRRTPPRRNRTPPPHPPPPSPGPAFIYHSIEPMEQGKNQQITTAGLLVAKATGSFLPSFRSNRTQSIRKYGTEQARHLTHHNSRATHRKLRTRRAHALGMPASRNETLVLYYLSLKHAIIY